MSGLFVCVVGPSGAGKDTLIGGAREALSGDARFRFPRRIVTRAASEAEDHDTLSPERFREMKSSGAFALSWSAHGLGYAIPGTVFDDIERRSVVVCNLSRRAVDEAGRRFATRVVHVTAPRDVLRSRILARGRESEAEVDRRLDRETEGEFRVDLTIRNVGAPEDHVAVLTSFLRTQADEAAS